MAAATSAAGVLIGASAAQPTGREDLKAFLLGLLDQRQAIETEMDVLQAALGEEGLSVPLVDEEGFPRADVDIVAIRHARSRYAKLQTDYSRIMARIEAGLEALHNLPLPEGVGPPSPATTARTSAASSSDGALARSTDASSAQPTPSIGITVAQPASLGVDALAPPVAVVNGVLPDGPAHMAGMRSGMEVLRFGTATAESLAASGQGLDALWGIAAASAGRDVEVVARLSTDRAAETLAAGAGSSVSALGAHLRLLLVRVPSPPRLGLHLVLPTSEPDTA